MACFNVFGILGRSNHEVSKRSGTKVSVEDNTLTCVSQKSGQTSISFRKLFGPDFREEDVFDSAGRRLISQCLSGFNVSLALIGSAGVSLNKLLLGEIRSAQLRSSSADRCGLLSYIFDNLFLELDNLTSLKTNQTDKARHNSSKTTLNTLGGEAVKVDIRCYEIDGNSKLDLLDFRNSEDFKNEQLAFSSGIGVTQSEPGYLSIEDSMSGVKFIQEAVERSKFRINMDKMQKSQESLMIELVISHVCRSVTEAYKSCITIALLPNIETVFEPMPNTSQIATVSADSELKSLNEILSYWPSNPSKALISYRDSTLTASLKETFGGNSLTSLVIGLEAENENVMGQVKLFLKTISNIRNVPILNTKNAMRLIDRYERTVSDLLETNKHLKDCSALGSDGGQKEVFDLKEQLKQMEMGQLSLANENISLKDELTELRVKFTQQIESKTFLSSKMVDSEHEKLKMSQDTVELQLENNKLKQDTERLLFELKSKNSTLQSKVKNLERHLAIEKRKSSELHEEVEHLRKEYKELSNEYVNVKHNHSTLTDAYDRQTSERENLLREIEDLVSSKEELLVGRDYKEISTLQRFRDSLRKISKKADHDVAQVLPNVTNRGRTAADVEKQLLLSNQERAEKLENLRLMHDKELEDFERKMDEVTEKLKSAETLNHRFKLKIAEQNGVCIVLKDKLSYLESVCKAQREKMDKLSAAYTMRLEEYISNLKEYVVLQSDKMLDKESITSSLDKMLTGFKSGYQSQLENLESRHNTLLAHAQEMYKSKETVLAAYKMVLWKIDEKESQGFDINDLTLPLPTESEIQMENARDRNELQTKLIVAEEKIKELEVKVDHLKKHVAVKDGRMTDLIKSNTLSRVHNGMEVQTENGLSLQTMQREMREFTINTQMSLEKERANLLTRCQLSEQQLMECQAFTESYLKRYQQEVLHLRSRIESNSNISHAQLNYPQGAEQRALLPPLDRRIERQYYR